MEKGLPSCLMIALSLTNLSKRFVAGAGPCHAAVLAVSNAYLDLATHELLGITGPSGSGKSTLLLCAAGLLDPDQGSVRWFDHQAQGRGRVIYLGPSTQVSRALQFMTPFGPPKLLLLDDPLRGIDGPSLGRIDAALRRLANAGGSAVITAREPDALRPLCSRVISMRGGKLIHEAARIARVAEPSL